MVDLKSAIAVFDKSADRTTPNAQTEAWKVIRAELMRLQDAPVVMLHTDSESADGEQIVEVMALAAARRCCRPQDAPQARPPRPRWRRLHRRWGGEVSEVFCPYCRHPAPLVTGREVYPHRPDLFAKPFYACLPCGAWVGCHPGTTQRLERLANAEGRRLKMAAHAAFDPRWRGGKAKRKDAYRWLAGRLGIEPNRCHIGYFNEDECRRVIEVCATPDSPNA